MKKRIITILPLIIMPIVIPIYRILDSLIFVDVFGCGCVPSAQTNMLNIPFNANDLRVAVFTVLAIALSVWGTFVSKIFMGKVVRIIYCVVVISINILLAMWFVRTFMWA